MGKGGAGFRSGFDDFGGRVGMDRDRDRRGPPPGPMSRGGGGGGGGRDDRDRDRDRDRGGFTGNLRIFYHLNNICIVFK